MKNQNLFEAVAVAPAAAEQFGVDRKVATPTELGADSESGVVSVLLPLSQG